MFSKSVWRSTFSVQRIIVFLTMLILVSLACALPSQSGTNDAPQALDATSAAIEGPTPTPTLPPPPTPTAQPLPPALVEANPPPGVDIPLQGALTFYF